MTGVVIDASTALAWCFPDETSDYADAVLVSLEGSTILVPAVWSLEIANAVLVGKRQKRLGQTEVRRFVALLEGLSLVGDARTVGEQISNIVPLASEHGLSAYDASYLELAIRRGVPLATLDRKLRKAGKQAGVEVFLEESATGG